VKFNAIYDSALADSPGRKAMEHSVIVVRKFPIFINILKIRSIIINLKHFKKNMFNILKNVKWNSMNNSYMNSGKTLFNLYEVKKSFLISRATII
jgi:hypothetical protein